VEEQTPKPFHGFAAESLVT